MSSFKLLTPFTKKTTALIFGIIGIIVFFGFVWFSFVGSGLISIGGSKAVLVFADGLNVLPKSSEVRVNGLQVGQVQSVELRDDEVAVTVSLDGSVQLKSDAQASLNLKSILGEKYVDLSPGTSSTPLEGPLTNTTVGVDFASLASGSIDSTSLYEDLTKEPVMQTLTSVADATPTITDMITDNLDNLRNMTENLVANQPTVLATIDDLATLTSALVGSSSAMGRLIDSTRLIEQQVDAIMDVATVQWARFDTAYQVVAAVISNNQQNIDALNSRLKVVADNGQEAYDLFQQGATIPAALFGLGPILEGDTRPNPAPTPNFPPPVPFLPYPVDGRNP